MHRDAILVTSRSRDDQRDSFLRQSGEGFFLEQYCLFKLYLPLDQARHQCLRAHNPGDQAKVGAVYSERTEFFAQINFAKETQ